MGVQPGENVVQGGVDGSMPHTIAKRSCYKEDIIICWAQDMAFLGGGWRPTKSRTVVRRTCRVRGFENWYVRRKKEHYIDGVKENVFMDVYGQTGSGGYNLVKMCSKKVLMDRSRCRNVRTLGVTKKLDC